MVEQQQSRALFEASRALDGERLQTLLAWLQASLSHTWPELGEAPPSLAADEQARTLLLTLSNGQGFHDTGMGTGQGITTALNAALDALRHSNWLRQPTQLRVDLIDQVEPHQLGQAPRFKPRSLFGLALHTPALICLPEALVTHQLVTRDGKPRLATLRKYLNHQHPAGRQLGRQPLRRSTALWRFSVQSGYVDHEVVSPLYRGHPMRQPLEDERLAHQASEAGAYLTRATGPSGRFVYSYQPEADHSSPEYNILRHAGTTWAMLDLYRYNGDTALLKAACRAVNYLLAAIRPSNEPGKETCCVVEGGEVKLGGQGLALICLAEHTLATGVRQHLKTMQGLAQWILDHQDQQGQFTCHKLNYYSGTPSRMVSGYYPGEAILGLMRLYQLDGQSRWLDGAERAAKWLIEVRDQNKTLDELEHDHWLLYGLNELQNHAPSPQFIAHAKRLAQAICSTQHRTETYPDWVGGWYRPPRTTPTATRCEGLAAAYQLLETHHHDNALLQQIAGAINHALQYILENQYSPANSLLLPNPRIAQGGFRGAHEQAEVRIDFVQHSLSALLLYLRHKEAQKKPSTQ